MSDQLIAQLIVGGLITALSYFGALLSWRNVQSMRAEVRQAKMEREAAQVAAHRAREIQREVVALGEQLKAGAALSPPE